MINNKVEKAKIESIVYESMLLNVFEKIFHFLTSNDNLFHFKRALRKCNDVAEEILVYKSFLKKVIQVELTDSEFLYIRKLTEAFMRKNNNRLVLTVIERQKIIVMQDSKCNICAKEITIENAHIDHQIAFKYVGDELPGNYQALCGKCNLSKSANLYYLFDFMLQKKA
ncbi:HNH endonuclease signature motif containing protein [Bacillus sp. BA3]|uniref:HNH endonuclease n=1 Tax=Bacillus sp. BA3 TaxID=2057910 RepID=UPI0012FF5270|nr:HNH endonuclease signature motif containing protein [Bacillus sp. BA3]